MIRQLSHLDLLHIVSEPLSLVACIQPSEERGGAWGVDSIDVLMMSEKMKREAVGRGKGSWRDR